MKHVGLMVTHGYYPARPDREEPDYAHAQLRLLNEVAPDRCRFHPVHWQDAGVDWSAFDAATPLMAWNYPRETETFLARLDEIAAAGVPLLNDADTVRANMDKGYLAELSARGAPTPPTLAVEACAPEVLLAAFDALDCDEIIVKPRIGAGAWRQARIARGAPLPDPEALPPAAALIQPFLPAVQTRGELSLLHFGGTFSHALMKTPKPGDYRTQGQHGAVETPVRPPEGALAAARAVLDAATRDRGGAPFDYARVDLVAGPDGRWLLMELELIEPWLYLDKDGAEGRHGAAGFVAATLARLRA
jgi:glutathione synthase/RimK-type ligase-like ATP-grasp enzyme